jgi:hypothetical protein
VSENDDIKKNIIIISIKYLILIFFILINIVLYKILYKNLFKENIIKKECQSIFNQKINKTRKNIYNESYYFTNNSLEKCYVSPFETDINIKHIIITRFLIQFYDQYGYPKKLSDKNYIPNGIRVMKKYLLPSLENQSCKNFIWILLIGNNANKSLVQSLLNINYSFETKIIYKKNFKKYLMNISQGFDVLITTRIDYDDCIYYDAVNDVRKAVNINKPFLLYGYNTGVYYFESEDKYYLYNYKNDKGVWSIFISLIIVLNKVNDIYSIYDLGDHSFIKEKILKSFQSYGIKTLNYEPTIFDSGDPKFIYVRQNYSGSYDYTKKIHKKLKAHYFNLSKFFGK